MAATLTLIEKQILPPIRRELSQELHALSEQTHRAYNAAIDVEDFATAKQLEQLRDATTILLLHALKQEMAAKS